MLVDGDQQPAQYSRQAILRITHDGWQKAAYMACPLPDDDPVLSEQPLAWLIAAGRACTSTLRTRWIAWISACSWDLWGHKPHPRPAHRLADGGRVIGVIFVGHEVRAHELGMDAPHDVSALLDDASPVCRTGARLHAHQTPGKLAKKSAT